MSAKPLRGFWRKRFRLSVRVWLILVLLLGGGLGWIVRAARVQREAVAAIRKAGGHVAYNWEWKNGHWLLSGGKPLAPNAPRWLVHTLGIDFFGHVALVSISLPDDPDEVFTHIGQLEGLEDLIL